MRVDNQYNTNQDKAGHHQDASISSELMFKELYDDLLLTYQTIIRHMEQVDSIIKEVKKDNNSD